MAPDDHAFDVAPVFSFVRFQVGQSRAHVGVEVWLKGLDGWSNMGVGVKNFKAIFHATVSRSNMSLRGAALCMFTRVYSASNSGVWVLRNVFMRATAGGTSSGG